MIWKLIGLAAATLTMFGFVPQIIKMLKIRSVEGVSIGTLIQFSFGVLLWLIYGIHLKDNILILANTVTFITLVIALTVYFKFKK